MSESQPLQSYGWTVVCNGELYNHETDCNALPKLLSCYDRHTSTYIDGVFAYVGFHPEKGFVASRDRVGVVPMYVGTVQNEDGNQIWFASMESALNHCDEVTIFPPGYTCYGTVRNTSWVRYTKPYEMPKEPVNTLTLRQTPHGRRGQAHSHVRHDMGCVPVRRSGLFDRRGSGGTARQDQDLQHRLGGISRSDRCPQGGVLLGLRPYRGDLHIV